MADAEPTVHPNPSIPSPEEGSMFLEYLAGLKDLCEIPFGHSNPSIPFPKEGGTFRDYLAGLEDLCETMEVPTYAVLTHPKCTNNVTAEDRTRLLYDAFQSPRNFMWHYRIRSFVRVYEAQDSTEDHTAIFYDKVDDNQEHRVTIMHVPYGDTGFAKRMCEQSVPVTYLID